MLNSLIKIRLGSLLSGYSAKDGKKGRFGTVGVIALIAVFVISFGIMFAALASSFAMFLVPLGFEASYFAIFNLLTFSVIFVLSVFETKSALFECRDNELLLSMPIPPRYVVLSRAISVLILNAGTSLVVSVPVSIVYALAGGNAWYIPSVIISSLLISVLATALSSGVGYIVSVISARMKHNTAVTVILSLVFLALYFVGYSYFLDTMTKIEEDPESAIALIENTIGRLAFLGNISLLKPVETPIFVVISVGISLLAWFVISKHYTRIITTSFSSGKRTYVHRTLSSGSALKALCKKEMAAFSSNATYILNSAIGAAFQLILAIMLLVSPESVVGLVSEFAMIGGEGTMELLVTAILLGCASITTISASALSLEGKNYWILKSSPIPAELIAYAKLAPHLLISVPASLVSAVISLIALGADLAWWPIMILTPLAGVLSFAILGLILNIAMPKFDFVNSVQVVKQSAPVFILTLGGMLLTAGMAVGSIALSSIIVPVLAAIIFLAFFVLLFLALYLVLVGPMLKKLEKI